MPRHSKKQRIDAGSRNATGRPDCAATSRKSEMDAVLGVLLPEQFIDSYGPPLRCLPRSRSLNRMFPEDVSDARDARRSGLAPPRPDDETTDSRRDGPETPSLITRPPDATEKPSRSLELSQPIPRISLKTTGTNFRMSQLDKSMAIFTNRAIIWLSAGATHVIRVNGMLEIPKGCFGIIMYRNSCPSFFSPTELVEPGQRAFEVQISNISSILSQALAPGSIEGTILIFRYFVPEPWEVINMTPPHEGFHHFIRTRETLRIKPYRILTVVPEATHVCAPQHSAIIIGTRHLNRSGVVVCPTIWHAGTMPVVTIHNVTAYTVRLQAHSPIARVVFTSDENVCMASTMLQGRSVPQSAT
uniref:GP72 n=1 Tax=Caviid herpesvirus 2 str. CIDMTR TaxID=1415526 RepID=U6H9W4_9BETA|nr:GP72 [Caviid herpesvirus 2 str. CIDMTR]